MIIDVFAARALLSSRLTRPVAGFVHTCVDETANYSHLAAKAKGFPQPSKVHTWPLPPPLPFSSNEIDRKKYHRNKHKAKAPRAKDQTKPKSACFTTSSDRDIRTTSSGHNSPMSNLSSIPCVKVVHKPLPLPVKPIFPSLQTVKRHYSRVFDYHTYRLGSRSTRYDKTVSSHIFKMVK